METNATELIVRKINRMIYTVRLKLKRPLDTSMTQYCDNNTNNKPVYLFTLSDFSHSIVQKKKNKQIIQNDTTELFWFIVASWLVDLLYISMVGGLFPTSTLCFSGCLWGFFQVLQLTPRVQRHEVEAHRSFLNCP